MTTEPIKPNRRSIRLRGYDYTWTGGYFVTLCTYGRDCLFGEVTDGEVHLSDFGQIVQEEWLKSAQIRSEIVLDDFVIMPNHLHGLIAIVDPLDSVRDKGGGPETIRATDMHFGGPATAPLHRPARSLGSFIAGFKSATTRRINALRPPSTPSLRQRNYFEHIIRSQTDLERVRRYIAENPARWDTDTENPLHSRG